MQSVADLTVGILGIPIFLVFLLSGMGKISNCIVAVLAYRSSVLSIGMSFVTLAVLTMDRYIAILQPYSYNTRVTRRKIVIFLCLGFMTALTVTIASLSLNGLIRAVSFLVASLSIASTAFVYVRIYLVVRKAVQSDNRIQDTISESTSTQDTISGSNSTKNKMFFREVKQAKSCFVVVMCFFLLCFLPVLVTFSLATDLGRYELLIVQNWATTLELSNSSVNSVIFFWTKRMLRKEALKMLNGFCPCIFAPTQ